MTEQQTKELFNIHIVTSDGRNILASGRNFLEVFDKGAEIEGAFLVTAYWFHREIPVWIAALDRLYADYEFHDGQRVDLAIKYLRAQGVQCPEFTNYLLRQSRYGTAPAGSVTELIGGTNYANNESYRGRSQLAGYLHHWQRPRRRKR